MKIKLSRRMSQIVNIVEWVLIAAGGCVAIYLWLAISFISAHIPTGSMKPTLLPGDYLLVCKWQRTDLPRGSFVLFVMPDRDSNFYMKRVMGAPGDTLEIRNFRYIANSSDSSIGHLPNQLELRRMFASDSPVDTFMRSRIYMPARPSGMGWTIREWGPMVIPRAGMTMEADTLFARLYSDAVGHETGLTLAADSLGRVCLGDSAISRYTFTQNHYFLGGDNVADSRDSRYLGLIPEEWIKGKGWFFWNSTDPHTGVHRWARIARRPK